MYALYVLQDKKGNFYKGITSNLDRRIKQHNNNESRGTRGKGPWKLVYYEPHVDRLSARVREKYLKSGMGREWLRDIIGKM